MRIAWPVLALLTLIAAVTFVRAEVAMSSLEAGEPPARFSTVAAWSMLVPIGVVCCGAACYRPGRGTSGPTRAAARLLVPAAAILEAVFLLGAIGTVRAEDSTSPMALAWLVFTAMYSVAFVLALPGLRNPSPRPPSLPRPRGTLLY